MLEPKLDDCSFDDLYREAVARLRVCCPEWRGELSTGDPAAVLLDAFAHLTEVALYRINRLPEKVHARLLNLIGLRRRPPSAASVVLRFSAARPLGASLVVPRGTRVSTDGSSGRGVVFATAEDVELPSGTSEVPYVEVLALHADLVMGELLGLTTGEAGQRLRLPRPPVIAPPAVPLGIGQLFLGQTMILGVESTKRGADTELLPWEVDGKRFVIWRNTETWSDDVPGWPRVFQLDPNHGEVELPEARVTGIDHAGGIPAPGLQVRAWYASGGGAAGNVAAGTITRLLDPIPGVSVKNPEGARGGRDAETPAQLQLRAPEVLRHQDRAVTASDYEALARRASDAIRRVFVHTPADGYAEDRPGTVEVLLVGDPAMAGTRENERALEAVREHLDHRRPLGSRCEVRWAPQKRVGVVARIQAAAGEAQERVRERVETRLNALLAPGDQNSGWEFGRTLHASSVYEAISGVPGVRHVVGEVLLRQTPAPSAIHALEADPNRPHTFYLASQLCVYRSDNAGLGWEPVLTLDEREEAAAIRAHPRVLGLLLVATRRASGGSSLHVSFDWGQHWTGSLLLDTDLRDAVWDLPSGSVSGSLEVGIWLAGSKGLRRITLLRPAPSADPQWGPEEDPVLTATVDRLAWTPIGAGAHLAAVCREKKSLFWTWLDNTGRATLTELWPKFAEGDQSEPWSVCIQAIDHSVRLWMGARAEGTVAPGCRVGDITRRDTRFKWIRADEAWHGGSCYSLRTRGQWVFAGTANGGILAMDTTGPMRWQEPQLPERSRFQTRDEAFLRQRLDALAVSANAEALVLLAGGGRGLLMRHDAPPSSSLVEAGRYHSRVPTETSDFVSLPTGWLFEPGTHELQVDA